MTQVLYRATRSRQKFSNAPEVRKAISDTLSKKTGPELKAQFNAVVSNWKSDVKFHNRKVIATDNIKVYVWPAGKDKNVWFYVDLGTKPHIIRPVNAPFLAFVGGTYMPKTSPIAKSGGPGVVVGGAPVFAKIVHHPGNEAREFTKTISDDYAPTFKNDMENAFRRGIRKL